MPTLYVTEQGARLEKEYRRVTVVKQDAVLMAVPLARIDHVVLVGNISVTTPALHALLDAQVGLTLLNSWGDLRGQLQPEIHKNLQLRHQQYACTQDSQRCLQISRSFVAGKLRNYRNLARRMQRSTKQAENDRVAPIVNALNALEAAPDLATLRGLEGVASKAYFDVLRRSLQPGLAFGERSRRPPKDPVNALLSLGYSLLSQNLMSACEIVGLDPYDGFFHSDRYGRPALALDLMEEFRAVIVDSVVLKLVNREMLSESDFQQGPEGGVYLKSNAMRTFFRAYAKRLNTAILHPASERKLTYQKCFEVQARQLRKVIEGSEAEYRPFLTR